MDNIFVDMSAEISSKYSGEETFNKSKRSAFVFIIAESDDSRLALEDLRKIDEFDDSRLALEDLRKIDEVKEVYLAHGAYDFIAKVNGESFDHLREIVSARIRNLSSIKSALTLELI